jgi:hypothetical protein
VNKGKDITKVHLGPSGKIVMENRVHLVQLVNASKRKRRMSRRKRFNWRAWPKKVVKVKRMPWR